MTDTRPELFYMVGAPGVGKSSVMSYVTANCIRRLVTRPFSHEVLARPDLGFAVELGSMRAGGYPGTDSLAMNVQPKVLSWMADCGYRLVLGEGDRLGNTKFLGAAMALGWRVHVLALWATDDQLAARRRQRGSQQDPSWMAGRLTKARNVIAWAREQHFTGAPVTAYELSTESSPKDLALAALLMVPSLQTLRVGRP